MLPKINKNPYYIYAPPYRSVSVGIKTLYLLCHHLNLKGENAFICCDSKISSNSEEFDDVFYNLNIRFINNSIIEFHKNNSYNPIVIYSDTVDGNPINASNIVRYMMNYDGLLKKITKDKNELNFAYSKNIAESLKLTDDKVLFIPASNPELFHPLKNVKRNGSCVYLGKYFDYHKGEEKQITKQSTKIYRPEAINLLKSFTTHSKSEIRDLLQKSEICYLYENSAIALEAVLCGCPAVFIPNKFLKPQEVHLSRNELGIDGYALNSSKEEIERAKKTVAKGRKRYLENYKIFDKQLDNFINITKNNFQFNNKNEIVGNEIVVNEIVVNEIVGNEIDFNKTILRYKKAFPRNFYIKKIKLKNSSKRIIFTTRIKVKKYNFGRIIKNFFNIFGFVKILNYKLR